MVPDAMVNSRAPTSPSMSVTGGDDGGVLTRAGSFSGGGGDGGGEAGGVATGVGNAVSFTKENKKNTKAI